jgi:hypothetical protein
VYTGYTRNAMEQRTPKQRNVKVCPYVPVEVRKLAEAHAKKAMKHVPGPIKATPFLSRWLVAGYEIETAKTDSDALEVVKRIRGKAFRIPSTSAPTYCNDCRLTSAACKCPGKPLSLPAVTP